LRLWLGVAAILAATLWLSRMAWRQRRPVQPGQAFFDFLTGAPRESVLAIGLLLLGCLAVAAHFLGGS
jgi:hypothetical protein